MSALLRVIALLAIFVAASAAWLVLGGIIQLRTDAGERALSGQVADLWGQTLHPSAPRLTLSWPETERRRERSADGTVSCSGRSRSRSPAAAKRPSPAAASAPT